MSDLKMMTKIIEKAGLSLSQTGHGWKPMWVPRAEASNIRTNCWYWGDLSLFWAFVSKEPLAKAQVVAASEQATAQQVCWTFLLALSITVHWTVSNSEFYERVKQHRVATGWLNILACTKLVKSSIATSGCWRPTCTLWVLNEPDHRRCRTIKAKQSLICRIPSIFRIFIRFGGAIRP